MCIYAHAYIYMYVFSFFSIYIYIPACRKYGWIVVPLQVISVSHPGKLAWNPFLVLHAHVLVHIHDILGPVHGSSDLACLFFGSSVVERSV